MLKVELQDGTRGLAKVPGWHADHKELTEPPKKNGAAPSRHADVLQLP